VVVGASTRRHAGQATGVLPLTSCVGAGNLYSV
jgi:hypothetical protein